MTAPLMPAVSLRAILAPRIVAARVALPPQPVNHARHDIAEQFRPATGGR